MTLLEIFDPKAAPKPIGIDLGTTHSLVACVQDDRPYTISDCDSEVLLPSVVAYGPKGAVDVGRHAKARASDGVSFFGASSRTGRTAASSSGSARRTPPRSIRVRRS